MRKLGLALGVTIAITAMMATPTTNFHVAKAYSCSSSALAGALSEYLPQLFLISFTSW